MRSPVNNFAEFLWSLQKFTEENLDTFRLRGLEHIDCLCIEIPLHKSTLPPKAIAIRQERETIGPSHAARTD